MSSIKITKYAGLLMGVMLLMAATVSAQDSRALIDALIKKGILNQDEATQIQKEMATANAETEVSTSGNKSLKKLSFSGRFQIQYAGLSTDISGPGVDPADTNHFFMRRLYFGFKADMGEGWTGNFNYDFAGSTFDAAFVQWKQSDRMVFDIGFRKVPFGLEEWYTSSGSLKAIERSPGTRYFVESNNGRRLGAGSFRMGLYLGGKRESGFFYNVALTDPERNEDGVAGVVNQGTASTNKLASWGNVGFNGKAKGLTYTLGASMGYLPGQGGKVLGAGDDLTVYNAFADITSGGFNLQLEYFGSDNPHGVSATKNASSRAYSIQPAYKVGKIEYVVRYSYLDSDGRGVALSDGIRSAPSGGTMNNMSETYLGFSYFFRGNDVKWQLGYILGESDDTVTGGAAKAKNQGVRSQMQVNF